MHSKTFSVPNISCGHCVHTIQEEVAEVEGVQRVQADEATRQVIVEWESPATWEQIEAKLIEINYPPAQPNVNLA
jgi:copper chaperone CopZ